MTTSGPVAQATATVSADGLLFLGADTTRVGVSITVTVVNETAKPVTGTLQDPAGATADTTEVGGGGTGRISVAATTSGKWTVKFDGGGIDGGMSKVVTVA
jgi:hypothetical protein